MPHLAQVIVDVPTMQTDRPFTYKIPNSLLKTVQVGMRVTVPFGPRQVEGFVVGFTDHHGKYQLKPITSLMDLTPAIDPEMMKLSRWLAKVTFSFRISCLLTMLPGVMKAKYQKRATLLKPASTPATKKLFNHQRVLIYKNSQLTNDQIRLLLKLKQRNVVKIDYLVKNQARAAKVMAFRSRLSKAQIKKIGQRLPKNRVAQAALLNFLLKHPVKNYRITQVARDYPHLSRSVVQRAAQNGWVECRKVERFRNPYKRPVKRNHPFVLNPDQKVAVNSVADSIKKAQATVYLLEGVTGSGKTEVYLQVIRKALNMNKTALMLVPEISLTPQMVNWVKGRFGDLVAILHSGLSAGEKYDEWRRIRNGHAKIVVGARSAIFAPLQNLGVIIMDEEHDSSYKQEDVPRYQTRQVAKWRGKYHHCPVVLGSATPSLESRARASKHVYRLLKLPHRINDQALPEVHLVNMKQENMKHHESNFSGPLLNAIEVRLERHEQVVLMLNRRGYSSFVKCRSCGHVPKCPNCDVSLTFHLNSRTLKCHYCGYEVPVPRECPVCHSKSIRYWGTGTEQAQRELQSLIPAAKIIRMDVDTTSRKGAHARLLREFGSGQANILLGTQMIAKGLDFPNVTLVGVLDADTSLDLPSFRSAERTFELLTQVSGRAGRANKKGEVFIQTFNPDNYAIRLAQQQDYERFYQIEMRKRHEFNYPPYFFTVRITASSTSRRHAALGIYQIQKYLLARFASRQTQILGPAPSPIAKLKRRYYYQLTIKYKREPQLQMTLESILNHYQSQTKRGLYISIDPEPVSFM